MVGAKREIALIASKRRGKIEIIKLIELLSKTHNGQIKYSSRGIAAGIDSVDGRGSFCAYVSTTELSSIAAGLPN